MKQLSIYIVAIILTGLCVFVQGCGEDSINVSKVVRLEAPEQVTGDGSSTFKIRAILDPQSDKTLREIIFKTAAGSFAEAAATDPKTVTVDAKLFNRELFAEVTWKVPSNKGNVEISAESNVEDLGGLYLVQHLVMVDTSIVKSVTLNASAFSVFNNFDSEVTITGKLMNANRMGVSSGTKVVIEDIFESTDLPVHGRFRSSQLSSNAASSITTIYSPGPISSDQDILLVATVLDQIGNKTSISDTLKLFVNKKTD